MAYNSAIEAETVVIGLGAVGSAVLYQLARRGIKAVGVDRFAPPHSLGSSHGETRITRQAVGEGAAYVPLVLASHRTWREVEAATGDTLLTACGALIMAPGGAPTSHHGKPDFVGRSLETATAFGIPHEVLDGREIRRRFPHLVGVTDNLRGYYEPGAGYVVPERCIEAQLRLAERNGAAIRTGTDVRALRQVGDHVEVETSSGLICAGRAVVSAGAWTGALLGPPFDRLLAVSRQVLHWFETEPRADFGERPPVFIWMHGASDVDYLYGFPPLPGDRRVKFATEQYVDTTTVEQVDRDVNPSESRAMFDTHVRGRVAGVTPRAVKAAACLYTVTPDRGFIIDRHPEGERVTVVSACSGHGFKHSAGIGFALAEEIATGMSPIDLAPFGIERFSETGIGRNAGAD